MSKAQFWILNVVGGVATAFILAAVFLGALNERTVRRLEETQARLNRAQQIQNTAQNLIVRLAQAARTEPVLDELLKRQELQVKLDDAPPVTPAP